MLTTEANDTITSMRYIDEKLATINSQIAVYQTARMAYANSLKSLLPKPKAKRGRKPKVLL